MEKIELVKASDSDVDYVYRIICELEDETFDYTVFREHFHQNVSLSSIAYYIIELNGNKCGFISIYTSVLLHHNARIAEIQEFIIEEKYRSGGIGRTVIELAEKICKDNLVEQLEVCTNIKRARTQQFYKNCGFNESHYKYTKKL